MAFLLPVFTSSKSWVNIKLNKATVSVVNINRLQLDNSNVNIPTNLLLLNRDIKCEENNKED